MTDDKRTRQTQPPAAPRGRASAAPGEDPPPNTPPPERAQRPPMPSIGRMALNARPSPDLSPEDRVLQALAQTEAAQVERQSLFEAHLKDQIKAIVTSEVKHSVPPPPPEKSMWAHVGPQLPAIIAALGAIIVSVAQSCSQPKELTPRIEKLESNQAAADKREAAKWQAQHAYDFSARYWTQDVLEKLDVQITDPLGAPDRSPDQHLDFYPAPKIDPHKVQKGIAAPRVQPKTPFPLPPPITVTPVPG